MSLLSFVFLCLASFGLVYGSNEEEVVYKVCSLSGDPHFKSFKANNWDYHGIGWFDLFRSPSLTITAEFDGCGRSSPPYTVSCMKNLVLSTTLGANPVLVGLYNGTYRYIVGTNSAVDVNPNDYKTMRTIPLTSVSLVYGSEMNVYGPFFWVSFRPGLVIIRIDEAHHSWGYNCGLCGLVGEYSGTEFRSGDSCQTISPTDSNQNWHSIRNEIKTWGDSLASPTGSGSILFKYFNRAVSGASGAYTLPMDFDAMGNCLASEWSAGCTSLCTDQAKPTCAGESALGTPAFYQCLVDWRSACRELGNPALATTWQADRRRAALLYSEAISPGTSAVIGIVIGIVCGVGVLAGLIFFFAQKPELLPFGHKKKTVKKQLATTGVLP